MWKQAWFTGDPPVACQLPLWSPGPWRLVLNPDPGIHVHSGLE